ncbi:MAG: N-acetylmuramoyl-L-alanine amidase [Clostridia bacterium]|nr:N-acetylmuramoyl-L-alanine amidase [Clostridia bacterium]
MLFMKSNLRQVSLYLLAGCLMLGASAGLGIFSGVLPLKQTVPASVRTETAVFVLDPGHGGEDGGAVAEDGTPEKNLNLEIALRMGEIADLLGYPTVLTRTDDTMLYDRYGDLEEYGGKKKTYDLRNRLRFAEESGCALFCSIHMNKFPDVSCSGLQVYYSPNAAESSSYAALLQSYARTFLDAGNTREIKKATSSIYLLHRIRLPAVLVECGFLSNPEEREKLQEKHYQLQLASVLTAALAEGAEAICTS